MMSKEDHLQKELLYSLLVRQQLLLYYQLAADNWKITWYIVYFGVATCNILLFSYYYEDNITSEGSYLQPSSQNY